MKIIVTGSLGYVSTPLVRELIGKGHSVTVISSTVYFINMQIVLESERLKKGRELSSFYFAKFSQGMTFGIPDLIIELQSAQPT